MISENDKIKQGEMKLQSAGKPPLIAGDYQLNAKVTLKGIDGGDAAYTNNYLTFTVTAPRFEIDLSTIYATYPIAGSSGAYHTSLPHIIFSRKTLPWERKMGNEAEPGAQNPWMGLLLLSETELRDNEVLFKEIPVKDVNVGSSEIFAPNITIEPWEHIGATGNVSPPPVAKAKVIEMPLALFRAIAPLPNDEMPYLAHTRQVDMLDKENTDINPKGWFSVLIGNRLPQQTENNFVFLVSMEGLLPAFNPQNNQKNVRVVVLAQWSFRSQGYTFEELVKQLSQNIKPLRMETADIGNKTTSNPAILSALKYGYCPLNHIWRNGRKTVSWYRGPLVPVDIPTPEQYIYKSADMALRFDENTGMFDISYASAWQLGRLLALQSPAFFKALSNWKAAYKRDKPLRIAKNILKTTRNVNPDDLAKMVNTAESDEVLTDLLIELWNQA